MIHHGTHIPVTTTTSENIEKVNSKVPTPHMPVPLLGASTNSNIDSKQPDSSNGNEEIVDQLLDPEAVTLQFEKSILPDVNISSKSKEDTTIDKNIESIKTGESIQVDEVSSSQMEEIAELETKKVTDEIVTDKSENLENQKEQVVKPNETEKVKNDNVQTSIHIDPTDSDSKTSNKFIRLKERDKTGVSNATQGNTFSANNEAKFASVVNKIRRSYSVKSDSFDNGEMKNGVLNGLRHKQQHPLFPAARTGVRTLKRRHSLNSSQNAFSDVTTTSNTKTYVKSRYSKMSTAKQSVTNNATKEDATKNTSKRTNSDCNIGSKRRHNSISQTSALASTGVENGCVQQEPSAKRRTRSEDRRQSPTDENDPANQAMEDANSRLNWLTSDVRSDSISLNGTTTTTLPGQDKLSSSSNTFQRRSLGKKATPVKAIRRSSINGSSRLQQLRGSFGLRDWDQGRNNRTNCNDRRTLNRTVAIIGPTDTTMPQRWLRLV